MFNRIKQNNSLLGFFLGLGLIVFSSGITYLIITLLNRNIEDDPKIFLFSFIPTIILMRWYIKLRFNKSGNAALFSLFIGFLAYSYYLMKLGVFIGSGFNF